MKEKSEFQTIFEKLISESQKSNFNNTDARKTQGLPHFEPLFFWNQKVQGFKVQRPNATKYYDVKPKTTSEAKMSVENKRQEVKKEIPKPIIRVKRNWNKLQLKAINQFYLCGENLREDATDDEIKSAYRRLVKKFHPDRGGKADDFREIVKAMKLLSIR